ncbi:hypothetical protein ACFC58_06230 [Kitasatospora purpeofusca]|uniref:hypothetical protein n=1 Tax=Kitasatospora purpeofusca TaxID=67352 RepID=UPI0035D99C26
MPLDHDPHPLALQRLLLLPPPGDGGRGVRGEKDPLAGLLQGGATVHPGPLRQELAVIVDRGDLPPALITSQREPEVEPGVSPRTHRDASLSSGL